MRINKFIAASSGMSRRKADDAITAGRITINGTAAQLGDEVDDSHVVRLDEKIITAPASKAKTTVLLNKPMGYVCSRDGQGSKTVYDLLPSNYHQLNIAGRLDKDSSGLVVLTNDGELLQQLAHPRNQKQKIYQVELNKPLTGVDRARIEQGVVIENYTSHMELRQSGSKNEWIVTMTMGKNRQIRKTFAKLGYKVNKLNRVQLGSFSLKNMANGSFILIANVS